MATEKPQPQTEAMVTVPGGGVVYHGGKRYPKGLCPASVARALGLVETASASTSPSKSGNTGSDK